MFDDGTLFGTGNTFTNLGSNPLLLAGLQMVGNNSPRVGQIPNTMEGVPNILLSASTQNRREQERQRQIAEEAAARNALSQALQNTADMSPEDAATYAHSPAAIKLILDQRDQQRSAAAVQDYLRSTPGQAQQFSPNSSGLDAPQPPAPPQQPTPQQQAAAQQRPAPQPYQPPEQQQDPEQQAVHNAAAQFDKFGLSTAKPEGGFKTVAEVAQSLDNKTAAAKLIQAAKSVGLSPDSTFNGQVLGDPSTAAPLARALGIGTDLSDDQFAQAHGTALQASRDRQAQRAQQPAPQQQPAAPMQTGASPVMQPAQQPSPQVGPATQQALAAQAARQAAMQQQELARQKVFMLSPEARVREAAKLDIQNLQKQMEPTADIREYGFYAQQQTAEGKPVEPFVEWQRNNKRSAAASTILNTVEGAQAAQHKTRLASDQKALEKMQEVTDNGNKALPAVNEIIRIADKTPSGYAGSLSPAAAKTLAALGVDVPESLSNAEKMNSLTRQLIPALRQPGSVSNYEDQTYMDAAPGLSQSAAGRKKIAEMFKLQIQRNNEYTAVYREHLGEPDLPKKLAEIANKPLLTEDFKREVDELLTGGTPNLPVGSRQGGASVPSSGRPPLSSFQR